MSVPTPVDRSFRSVNPATGELLETWAPHEADRVDADLERAVRAFANCRDAGLADRALPLRRVADGWFFPPRPGGSGRPTPRRDAGGVE